MRQFVALILCAGWLGSCCTDPAAQGDEGQACYPNDTCNIGLTCVSGQCEGPGADCGDGVCDTSETALSCPSDCGAGSCGDGIVDGDLNEVCDGTELGGQTCLSLGHLDGTLACDADCADFDEGGCHSCGDVVIQIPEICDASNLGGLTCRDVGFASGTLACAEDCLSHVTTDCSNTCVAANCTACIASPCAQDACSVELDACNANADCLSLYQCLQLCSDAACESSCNIQFSLGVTDYEAAQACLVCDADVCASECIGTFTCP